jgi:hypothetical protein
MLMAAEVLARVGAEVILDAGVRERVRDAFRVQPQRRPEWTGSGI